MRNRAQHTAPSTVTVTFKPNLTLPEERVEKLFHAFREAGARWGTLTIDNVSNNLTAQGVVPAESDDAPAAKRMVRVDYNLKTAVALLKADASVSNVSATSPSHSLSK